MAMEHILTYFFIFQQATWRQSNMANWRESVVKVEPPEIDDTCENQMGGNSFSPTRFQILDSKEVIDLNINVVKKEDTSDINVSKMSSKE